MSDKERNPWDNVPTTVQDDWNCKKYFSRSGQADVFLVEDKGNVDNVAILKVFKHYTPIGRLRIFREVKVLRLFAGKCSFIPTLFDCPNNTNVDESYENFKLENIRPLYMLINVAPGVLLSDALKAAGVAISLRSALEFTRKLLKIFQDIHNNNIIHRDIKPDNLMFAGTWDDPQITILDFGLAFINENVEDESAENLQTETELDKFIGNKFYQTPPMMAQHLGNDETLQSERKQMRRKPAIDIAHCGAILFKLLTLQDPLTPTDQLGLPPHHRAQLKKMLENKLKETQLPASDYEKLKSQIMGIFSRSFGNDPTGAFLPSVSQLTTAIDTSMKIIDHRFSCTTEEELNSIINELALHDIDQQPNIVKKSKDAFIKAQYAIRNAKNAYSDKFKRRWGKGSGEWMDHEDPCRRINRDDLLITTSEKEKKIPIEIRVILSLDTVFSLKVANEEWVDFHNVSADNVIDITEHFEAFLNNGLRTLLEKIKTKSLPTHVSEEDPVNV